MRIFGLAVVTASASVLMADPVMAAFSMPAPSNVGLLVLGIVGLFIGRRAVAGPSKPKDDSAA